MVVLYTLICITILFYTIIVGQYTITYDEINVYFDGFLYISTKTCTLICLYLKLK